MGRRFSIYSLFMDIHNLFMGIHNLFMDIPKSFMDIHNSFINDLPLSVQYCSSDFYADDATFHTHDKDIHTIENRIQSDSMPLSCGVPQTKCTSIIKKHPV